mmetsp:Transcript_20364/g.68038  ORF Transcript_20364/g.68038 Transcript_20364/m.68038 type:complete len:97 (-) Transcript_20364:3219-3509(-)
MQHGPDCICYGFDFGVRDRVVYLSDFTSISEEVYEVIEERSALEVSPLPASIFVLIFLSSTQGSKHPRPRQPQVPFLSGWGQTIRSPWAPGPTRTP